MFAMRMPFVFKASKGCISKYDTLSLWPTCPNQLFQCVFHRGQVTSLRPLYIWGEFRPRTGSRARVKVHVGVPMDVF